MLVEDSSWTAAKSVCVNQVSLLSYSTKNSL